MRIRKPVAIMPLLKAYNDDVRGAKLGDLGKLARTHALSPKEIVFMASQLFTLFCAPLSSVINHVSVNSSDINNILGTFIDSIVLSQAPIPKHRPCAEQPGRLPAARLPRLPGPPARHGGAAFQGNNERTKAAQGSQLCLSFHRTVVGASFEHHTALHA